MCAIEGAAAAVGRRAHLYEGRGAAGRVSGLACPLERSLGERTGGRPPPARMHPGVSEGWEGALHATLGSLAALSPVLLPPGKKPTHGVCREATGQKTPQRRSPVSALTPARLLDPTRLPVALGDAAGPSVAAEPPGMNPVRQAPQLCGWSAAASCPPPNQS